LVPVAVMLAFTAPVQLVPAKCWLNVQGSQHNDLVVARIIDPLARAARSALQYVAYIIVEGIAKLTRGGGRIEVGRD
jgi:hypothetical protein